MKRLLRAALSICPRPCAPTSTAADGWASRRNYCARAAGPDSTDVAAAPRDAERIAPHSVSADFAADAGWRASPRSRVAEMPGVGFRWRDAARRLSIRNPAVPDADSKACWAERLRRSEHADSVSPAAADAERRRSTQNPAVLDAGSKACWAEPLHRSEHADSRTPAAADGARGGSSAPALRDLLIPDVRSRSEAGERCGPAQPAVAAMPCLLDVTRSPDEARSLLLQHSDSKRPEFPAFRAEWAAYSVLLPVLGAEACSRCSSEALLRFRCRVDGPGSWLELPACLRTERASAAAQRATPPDAR